MFIFAVIGIFFIYWLIGVLFVTTNREIKRYDVSLYLSSLVPRLSMALTLSRA